MSQTYSLRGARASAGLFLGALLDGVRGRSGSSATTTRALGSRLVCGLLDLALATSSSLATLGGLGGLGIGCARRSTRGASALLVRGGSISLHLGDIFVLALVLVLVLVLVFALVALLLLNTVALLNLNVGLVFQADNGLDGFDLEDLGNNWAGVQGFLVVAQILKEVGPDVRYGDVVAVIKILPDKFALKSVSVGPADV